VVHKHGAAGGCPPRFFFGAGKIAWKVGIPGMKIRIVLTWPLTAPLEVEASRVNYRKGGIKPPLRVNCRRRGVENLSSRPS
jgi:hypothetical protein